MIRGWVNQLCRRSGLLVFIIPHVYLALAGRRIAAEGGVLAMWQKNASPTNDANTMKIGPNAVARITCQEIESFDRSGGTVARMGFVFFFVQAVFSTTLLQCLEMPRHVFACFGVAKPCLDLIYISTGWS